MQGLLGGRNQLNPRGATSRPAKLTAMAVSFLQRALPHNDRLPIGIAECYTKQMDWGSRRMARPVVALAAVVVLLMQFMLPAWAGVHSAGPLLDIFGNPLCITGADGHSSAPAEDLPKQPDCCIHSCSAVAHAAIEPDTAHSLLVHPAVPLGFSGFVKTKTHIAPDEYNPGSPRAPPSVL